MDEISELLQRYEGDFDEPETLVFLAAARARGILDDGDWQRVLRWVDDAVESLRSRPGRGEDGALLIDADPRNADWIRLAGAQRLAGARLPSWAALWLWWIGHDRPVETYWLPIGRLAAESEYEKLRAD
jgi:hypothetical protein